MLVFFEDNGTCTKKIKDLISAINSFKKGPRLGQPDT